MFCKKNTSFYLEGIILDLQMNSEMMTHPPKSLMTTNQFVCEICNKKRPKPATSYEMS